MNDLGEASAENGNEFSITETMHTLQQQDIEDNEATDDIVMEPYYWPLMK